MGLSGHCQGRWPSDHGRTDLNGVMSPVLPRVLHGPGAAGQTGQRARMTIREDGIMGVADRLRAAWQRPIVGQRDMCGARFEAVAPQRDGSDVRRVKAAPVRTAAGRAGGKTTARQPIRTTPHETHRPDAPCDSHESALHDLFRTRAWISAGPMHGDSRQVLREVREERATELKWSDGRIPG